MGPNLYNFFLSLSFEEATLYIENNMTDVTFWYLILIFSHLGIPFPFLAGLVTGISLGILFYIFRKSVTENKLSKFMILTLFITLICSFHLPSLFDGLRFFFAQSFIILGFYLSLVRNQTLKGLTSLLFAATIHFSTVVFFIATLFYVLFQKNYKLLIDQLKDTDYELDLIGDGSRKNELKNYSKELNSKVNFLGKKAHEDLIEFYKNYRIFISSSLYEGNSKVILEAMASGYFKIWIK